MSLPNGLGMWNVFTKDVPVSMLFVTPVPEIVLVEQEVDGRVAVADADATRANAV